jgi:ABC-type sugar transport system ATPase subunit
MVSVRFEHVTKLFEKKVVAVDDLNLMVRDSEFMVLLGPSGCGKTTTLLMVAGIYNPTKGVIYFDDRAVNNVEPKDRNVGVVFQSYALYPHMTVFDNISFPLRIKKISKDEISRRVREVAELLRLEELLQRKPSQLSGGQQQRVALARALVKRPDVFLMDEPLSNLDARIRVEVRAEIKNLQKSLKITTIYVTHDQVEAMSLADRVALMNAGKLLQVGTPEEVYSTPADLFVGTFIGSPPANVLPIHLMPDETCEISGIKFELPYDIYQALLKFTDASSELKILIRPEHLRIHPDAMGSAKIFTMEPLGRETILHLELPDGQHVKSVISGKPVVNEGEKVNISIDFRHAHFYKNGKLII